MQCYIAHRSGDRFLNSSWSADGFNRNFWFNAKIIYISWNLVVVAVCATNSIRVSPFSDDLSPVWVQFNGFHTSPKRTEPNGHQNEFKLNQTDVKAPSVWAMFSYIKKNKKQNIEQFCLFNLTDFNVCCFVCALLAGLVYFSAPIRIF